ncbi:MAG TPA: hypothetical protein VE861_07350 [Gemmatimonadaceae bacterium]|nr:hypothetical protein [Gemmatimonadaceae bacterium]
MRPSSLSRFPQRPALISAGIVLAVSVAMPVSAGAQFGGALKRAVTKKVEQKAEDRVDAATLIAPTFDGTTLELTAERLDRYTAAMQKLKGERAQNRQRYDALQQEAAGLREAAVKANNANERRAFDDAVLRHRECRDGVRDQVEAEAQKRADAIGERMQRDPAGAMNDPRVKDLNALLIEMATAQQRNDTAALDKLRDRMMVLMGGATDSVSLDKASVQKCGPRPTPPASVVKVDSLTAKAQALVTQANALLSTTGGVKGADVGMTDVQSRMVWERIQSWLNGVQEKAPITRTFSKAEYDLLVARRGALRAAFSGSE